MSINLGTAAIEALGHLRTLESWPVVMGAIEEVTTSKLHAALNSSSAERVDATAYARALHDVFIALSAASQRVNARAVAKLGAKQMADA